MALATFKGTALPEGVRERTYRSLLTVYGKNNCLIYRMKLADKSLPRNFWTRFYRKQLEVNCGSGRDFSDLTKNFFVNLQRRIEEERTPIPTGLRVDEEFPITDYEEFLLHPALLDL